MSPRRILVLHTGGTLGMNTGPKGYEPVPGMLERELARSSRFHDEGSPRLTLPGGVDGRAVHYTVRELAPLLDSSNMGMSDWARVARAIEAANDEADAFVVIHGTDTMAYATSALSFMLVNLKKTVILTGSQIPFAHVRNDAHDNLLGALSLAARYDIPEVCLYFRDKLLRGNRVTKVDAEGLDAFASANLRPLAEVGTHVEVAWDLVRTPNADPFTVRPIRDPRVACVRMFPGMSNDTLDRILQPPLQGAVLLTYGTGNGPDRDQRFLEVLRRATDDGIVLLNISQCLRGSVQPDYAAGRALVDAGVISGHDMTAEAALTKMAFLLSQPDLEREQVRRFLQVDLRGELTPPNDAPRFSFRERRFVESVRAALGERSDAEVGRVIYPVLLTAAAQEGDLDAIARMLASGAPVDAVDLVGRTPVHAAAAAGRADVVQWLLARGADGRRRDSQGSTPADLARAAGHDALADVLDART